MVPRILFQLMDVLLSLVRTLFADKAALVSPGNSGSSSAEWQQRTPGAHRASTPNS